MTREMALAFTRSAYSHLKSPFHEERMAASYYFLKDDTTLVLLASGLFRIVLNKADQFPVQPQGLFLGVLLNARGIVQYKASSRQQ